MKIVLLMIALTLSISCSSQELKFQPGCWMPENYIAAVKKNPFDNHVNSLKPVESIVISGDSILVKTYGGDLTLVQTRRADSNRIEVVDAPRLFNLKYFSKEELKDKRIFLSNANDYLQLQIQDKKTDQAIRFVNHIDGFSFASANEPFLRSALNGRYRSQKEPMMDILIMLNGEIRGTRLWNSYQFRRYHSRSTNGVDYVLLALRRTDGTKVDVAVKINKEELIMYEYIPNGKSDFDILIQGEPLYIFKKVL